VSGQLRELGEWAGHQGKTGANLTVPEETENTNRSCTKSNGPGNRT